MDINYNEIDELCRPMVQFFNGQGLTTKFSCQGHDNSFRNQFDIIFDENVTDDDICNFISKYSNDFDHTPFVGKFTKWIRKVNNIITCNWCYTVAYGDYKTNQNCAIQDFKTMVNNTSR